MVVEVTKTMTGGCGGGGGGGGGSSNRSSSSSSSNSISTSNKSQLESHRYLHLNTVLFKTSSIITTQAHTLPMLTVT